MKEVNEYADSTLAMKIQRNEFSRKQRVEAISILTNRNAINKVKFEKLLGFSEGEAVLFDPAKNSKFAGKKNVAGNVKKAWINVENGDQWLRIVTSTGHECLKKGEAVRAAA